MRKILFIILLIFPVFTFAQTRVKVGNLYYNINGTTATVARNLYNSFTSDYRESLYEIPEYIYYNGVSYTVIGIDDLAFSAYKSDTYGLSASGVRTVKIPKTVKTIGKFAFSGCENLRNVIFTGPDNSLTEIGASAFNGCIALSRILVPAHVEKLGNAIFDNSHIQTIEYIGVNPPENWVAAEKTYVTSKYNYKSPTTSISDIYDIEELVSFTDVAFIYNANNVSTSWNANYEKDWECISIPELEKDAGEYRINISFSFIPYYCNGSSTEKFYIEIPYFYTISPLTLTATAQDAIRNYGDNNPTFEVKYSGFINNEDESVLSEKPIVSTTASPKSDVGTFPITVSGGSAKNYDFNYKEGVLTINKAPLSARVVDASRLYGAENPNFSLSYQGLKNNETVPKWTEVPNYTTDATTSSSVGEYVVYATANPTNYTLTINPGILTVTPATLTIKANDASRLYFDADPEYTYVATGFLNGDTSTSFTQAPKFKTNATATSNVGTYTITPYGAESRNYNVIYETGNLSITKRMLTATADAISREYGEDNPPFSISYDGFVNNENESTLDVIPSATTPATPTSNVGTYTVSLNGGSATNYNFTLKSGILTITKASLAIVINDATRTYGVSNPSFGAIYSGLKNNETIPAWSASPNFKTTATITSAVGSYPIEMTSGTPRNYEISGVTNGTLSITPAQLTIKAKDASKTYYEENPSFTYVCTGFVNGDNASSSLQVQPTLSTTANQYSNVGTYEIVAKDASSNNYNIVYAPGTFTINKRLLVAKVGNFERIYGEENPPFNVTYTGFVNNETEDVLTSKGTVSTAATPKSDVGTYPVTLTGASARNYTITAEPGTLTVTKAPLTAKVSDVTRLYGQNNPQFSFTLSGLKNGETSPQWTTTPTLTTTADTESPVGLYPIEVSGGEAKNYEFTASNGTLTINKAELTITADNKSRPYFEENPTLTCKYTGFVNGENSSVLTTQPTLKTNAEQTSDVGNYPITVSGAEAQNYSIAYKQGNMEVTKRQLTVSTDNYTREYKEENPKFVLRYMGFVNNETEDVLINKPIATTQATVDSDAGIYPITISGGVAANYDFLYTNSNLTIEKTYQTLSWTQELEEMEVYSQTELKAKATSELYVTYTIVSGEGASVSKVGKKTYLECTKAGTIVICAQQTGNNNYYESNKVYKTIRVGKANPSDVNGDNVIDSADIVAVIKEMPDGDMKADVNGDGVIDSADIVAVIKAMK